MRGSSLGYLARGGTTAPASGSLERVGRVDSGAARDVPVSRQGAFLSVLRPFVLGSVDGLVTSFVIVAAGFAGDLPKSSVLLVGFASLFADAFSMGVSEYLSSRSTEERGRTILFGLTCFVSFVLFGSVPLLGYALMRTRSAEVALSVSLFAVMLVVVAVLRAFVAGTSVRSSLCEVGVLGACAGGIAYGVASIRL